jgi:nitrilase
MADTIGCIKAAVVQSAGAFLDRDGAVRKAEELISEAGAMGAELVVFPEGYIPAHPIWFHFHAATSARGLAMAAELFRNAVVVGGSETDRLCAAAKRAGVWVIIGICEKLAHTTGTMWNSALHITPQGTIAANHRKISPTVGERLVHIGGGSEGLELPRASFGSVSSLICAENSNPLLVFSVVAQYAVVHAALWPNHFSPTQPRMRDVILNASRAIAYQGGCFVLNAAGTLDEATIERVARDDADRAWLHDEGNLGGSCIVSPGGELLAGQAGAEETILIAELDLDIAVAKRSIHDFAGHYNRADLLGLVVHPTPHALFQAPWQKGRRASTAETPSNFNAIGAAHTPGVAREEAAAAGEGARSPGQGSRQPS